MSVPNITANQLMLWAALLGGLLLAVLLGSAVGSSDMRFVAAACGLIPLLVILVKLRTNIWVLVPIGWFLSGRLPWLPLPFAVRDLCCMVVILSFAAFVMMRIVPWKRKLGSLDYLVFINLAYLMTVFLRNPVGVWAFQSQMVGGRPYFEITLAFMVFLVLSRATLTQSIANIFPFLFIIPAGIAGALDVIARVIPQTSYPIAMFYSGAGSMSDTSALQAEAQIGESRLTGVKDLGMLGVLALCSRYNPITLLSPIHPLRLVLFLATIGIIFLSGFRSALVFALVSFALGAVLRRRMADLWITAGVMILGLMLLISVQGNILRLPATMQRSLSWLPGDWDTEVLNDAQGSSQWRFDMWIWAWNDERIFRDKIWGQGFGFTYDEMNIMASALLNGSSGPAFIGSSAQESQMITGSFHSGPLSSIKFIGIVGFALYYSLMVYMGIYALQLCRRAYATKAFTLALFICIPIIYEPFNYIFVFGALDSNYSQILFWAGLLNMANNYLDGLVLTGRTATTKSVAVSQSSMLQPAGT
jgi:hypothetical protein